MSAEEMKPRIAPLLLLALLALLLVGCDQKALLNKIVPKDDDAFARHFLDLVRTGDYAAADAMLDASMQGAPSTSGLHDLNGVLAHGEPLSVEIIGCYFFAKTSTEGSGHDTTLSYQIHFADSWVAGNVIVAHPSGKRLITTARFQPIADSLETLNRFTLSGKSVIHYLVFAGCVLVPTFILVVLIICIRSRIRRKWLWIIFILLGFGQFQLNWTTGHFNFQPISFVIPGASFFRPGMYSPWVLGVAIPVGAIVFLIFRRKLLRPALPERTESAPSNERLFRDE